LLKLRTLTWLTSLPFLTLFYNLIGEEKPLFSKIKKLLKLGVVVKGYNCRSGKGFAFSDEFNAANLAPFPGKEGEQLTSAID